MKKLLTVCIPTYKRHVTLGRCIDSVVTQIDKFGLSDSVGIYVANDSSPDETTSLLSAYGALSYFGAVTRKQNLGMNVNIKTMLQEVALESRYQMILTDDDYLQPDILFDMVEFLIGFQRAHNAIPTIWTPRYSYRDNGELHCVVCSPKMDNFLVRPSAVNAGRYMDNGFILSGLIVQANLIDYEYWGTYEENAYFPVIFFGQFLFEKGAYFWNRNIVHHTVLNECPWERWGDNDTEIDLRLFADYVNAYNILANKVQSSVGIFLFYLASSPSIYKLVNDSPLCERIVVNKFFVLDVVNRIREQGIMRFGPASQAVMIGSMLVGGIVSGFKVLMLFVLSLLIQNKRNKEQYCIRAWNRLRKIKALPTMIRIALS